MLHRHAFDHVQHSKKFLYLASLQGRNAYRLDTIGKLASQKPSQHIARFDRKLSLNERVDNRQGAWFDELNCNSPTLRATEQVYERVAKFQLQIDWRSNLRRQVHFAHCGLKPWRFLRYCISSAKAPSGRPVSTGFT